MFAKRNQKLFLFESLHVLPQYIQTWVLKKLGSVETIFLNHRLQPKFCQVYIGGEGVGQ
jgi:hypothetical protein